MDKECGPASIEFWAKVDAKVEAGLSKMKAISSVVRAHPDLHTAMIEEANAGRGA